MPRAYDASRYSSSKGVAVSVWLRYDDDMNRIKNAFLNTLAGLLALSLIYIAMALYGSMQI